jgi:hypothetical protein
MADVVVARRSPVASIIYVLFGILEALLLFRFIFLLLGASPNSGFVTFIYNLTEPLVSPFYGIFGQVTTRGVETTARLDPATLIAMIVYGLVAWAIVRLVAGFTGRPADPAV